MQIIDKNLILEAAGVDMDNPIAVESAMSVLNETAKASIANVKARYMGDNNREDMEVRRCVNSLCNAFGFTKIFKE